MDTLEIVAIAVAGGMVIGTLLALARMVKSAKCNLVGVGVVVEKTFEGGRALMLSKGYGGIPIHALATIVSMNDGKIEFAQE